MGGKEERTPVFIKQKLLFLQTDNNTCYCEYTAWLLPGLWKSLVQMWGEIAPAS
jgi:hypothetical protein